MLPAPRCREAAPLVWSKNPKAYDIGRAGLGIWGQAHSTPDTSRRRVRNDGQAAVLCSARSSDTAVPTRAYNPPVPAFVRIAIWCLRLSAIDYIETGSRVLSHFADSDSASRVLSGFVHNGAALPDVSAVVAFAPPAAPWSVACDAAICCDREIVDDSVAHLFLGGANGGSAVAGLRKALDVSVPGVPIRTCQRRTPVVVRVANIDEEAAFHVPQVELLPELTGADFALIAAHAIESICFGQQSWR